MNKKSLSERDICTKFIAPAIAAAGWDIHELPEQLKAVLAEALERKP